MGTAGVVAYWAEFEQAEDVMYQEIQFHPVLRSRPDGMLWQQQGIHSCPRDDLYLLAVLNSPLMWWHNWRYLPHMKDEALSPVAFT